MLLDEGARDEKDLVRIMKIIEVSRIASKIKRLNAKPCGILDSAHTTHGLNP